MEKIKYLVIILITLLSFSSCASFSEKIIENKTTPLTQEKLQHIEGTYAMKSYDSYIKLNIDKEVQPLKEPKNNTISELTNGQSLDEIVLDKVKVDVKIVADDKIRFLYRIQDSIIKKDSFTFKLQENGMLHLENREIDSSGIPHFIGRIEIKKSRIGLSKNNDLLINHVYFKSNVALILGYSLKNNTSFYFKRLSK
ncbi:hypothetical protein [Kordia sp.]|uniref:hypothetical protein n=1 Tax=Kordia sp. TaxID=1965332 RepID=UPI003B5AF307